MTSWMRLTFPVIFAITACVLAVAQEMPVASEECVQPGERIYNAEKDKVKPPKLVTSQREQLPPSISGDTWLELLVNSERRLCHVHILKTTDHDAARQIATYVASHWKVQPAVHEGKPVAVLFRSNFASLPQR